MRRTIPIDPAVAAALAARRRAARLTQNDIARALNVSEATISKIETARVGVDPATCSAIERAIERLAQNAGTASAASTIQQTCEQGAMTAGDPTPRPGGLKS
jgi:transcriptional regulator with XRE-family HTH domain